ncbi:MAG: Rab family GTPase [Promethearchaeota archaeon]
MSNENFDYLFKVVLVGDAEVGKTSLTTRFAYGTFTDQYISTLGVDFVVKTLSLKEYIIKLQVWDTAGQERYAGIRPIYYRGAKGAVLIFDLTRRQTFLNVEKWIEQIHRYASPGIPIILVGNKLDLVDAREVTPNDIEALTTEKGLEYFETSAKVDHGVNETFAKISELILQNELDRSQSVLTES